MGQLNNSNDEVCNIELKDSLIQQLVIVPGFSFSHV